jgi:type IV secretion system protein VirD4
VIGPLPYKTERQPLDYQPPRRPLRIPTTGPGRLPYVIAIAAIIALWMSTQYLAHVWSYHTALGPPLVTLNGSYGVYAPYRGLVWMLRYRSTTEAIPTLYRAFHLWAVTMTVGVVTMLGFRRRQQRRTVSVTHGSARWGTGTSLRQETGLILGRDGDQLLRYRGEGHLVTIAPTRSGKGVSAIIPNLLTYPGSVIVTDPKGENFAVTARRRQELGTEVVAFDPFGIVQHTLQARHLTPAAYNPLDLLAPDSPDLIDDARLIADMLVVVDGKESGEQSFWNEEARALLTGLILYVACTMPPPLRTLTHVRTLLTLPPALFDEVLTHMQDSDAAHGLIARAAHRMQQKADKERSGVMSSAHAQTHFLDSPRMTTTMAQSTLTLTQVKQTPTSIYLIIPPDRIAGYHRWIRLMLAMTLLAVTRTSGAPSPRVGRVLFVIDEFGHLGTLRPIEQYIGLASGYGASFWIFLQDLSQLKAVYAQRWTTFVANADVLQVFGVNDGDTAEYISKLTGETTTVTDSENQSRSISHGRHGSRQQSTAATRSERGRRLLLPDEVRRTADHLVFVKQCDPLRVTPIQYFANDALAARWFAGHFDPNPLHAPNAS